MAFPLGQTPLTWFTTQLRNRHLSDGGQHCLSLPSVPFMKTKWSHLFPAGAPLWLAHSFPKYPHWITAKIFIEPNTAFMSFDSQISSDQCCWGPSLGESLIFIMSDPCTNSLIKSHSPETAWKESNINMHHHDQSLSQSLTRRDDSIIITCDEWRQSKCQVPTWCPYLLSRHRVPQEIDAGADGGRMVWKVRRVHH